MSGDILDDCVQYLIKGGMLPEEANRFEEHMRHLWGGDEAGYIAKKKRADEEKKKAAVEEVRKGAASPKEAADRHGIPRSTMYRLIEMERFKS